MLAASKNPTMRKESGENGPENTAKLSVIQLNNKHKRTIKLCKVEGGCGEYSLQEFTLSHCFHTAILCDDDKNQLLSNVRYEN